MKISIFSRHFFSMIFLGALFSCAHTPGYESNRVEGVKIIKSAQGAALSKFASQDFEQPFPKGEDSTKTVVGYLEAAEKLGAAYVSDLELIVQTEKETCSTFVLPEEDIKARQVIQSTMGWSENKYVSKPVTRLVTENEYRCQYVQKPVQRAETTYENQYDYSTKSTRWAPKTQYVTKYESQNECRFVPVTKTVTRYEYQYETQYIPPKTEYLTQYYSEWKLGESTPQCKRISRGAAFELKEGLVRGKIYLPKK